MYDFLMGFFMALGIMLFMYFAGVDPNGKTEGRCLQGEVVAYQQNGGEWPDVHWSCVPLEFLKRFDFEEGK